MSSKVIHLKNHQFKKGYDPKRNLNGPPKGNNPLVGLKKNAVAKHTNDIEDIIEIVIEQAKSGNDKSQTLIFNTFVLNAITDLSVTDLAVTNCHNDTLQQYANMLPKHILEKFQTELEKFQAEFIKALNEYNQTKEGEEEFDSE